MVRETRFAFDDDFPDSNHHSNEDFTDEDDRFLDAFSHPEDRKTSGKSANSLPKQSNPQRKSETENKHLSDADWLNTKPKPRSRRRKSA